jgi:hypothetical protein
MTSDREKNRNIVHEGYQPNSTKSIELGGFQPQAVLPPKPTPPKTGTAIQPPQQSTEKPSEPKQ